MRVFSALYDRVMQWSRHRHAPYYLAGLSFAESSFFPIPPDVMLAPMSMANPRRSWWLATLTTVASVLGGLLGYAIGAFAFDLVQPWIGEGGRYQAVFHQAKVWFDEWGVWAIFIAGFSPIPYKVFTIAAGVLSMAIIPFVLASVIGRGARFYLVAALMAWGGERMEGTLRRYVDRIGWIMLLLIVAVVLAQNFRG
jgi:membrane protein YqaA with SNARE-associated domain